MAGWEKKPSEVPGLMRSALAMRAASRSLTARRRRSAGDAQKEDERQRVAEAKKARVKCVYCKRASCIC